MLIEAHGSVNPRLSSVFPHPPTAAAAAVARGYLLTQMHHLNPAVVVEAGADSPCGESTLCCCIYYKRSQKCPGWSLSQQPRGGWCWCCWCGGNATDGSICAETNFSLTLIIYSVCSMLLSKVPCGVVSACIFNTSGLTGTMKFHHESSLMPVFLSSPVSTLSHQQYRKMISACAEYLLEVKETKEKCWWVFISAQLYFPITGHAGSK